MVKVVIITGASSGIGKAIALALAARNNKAAGGESYHLVLAARRKDALEAVVEACGGASVAVAVPTDVTVREDVKALMAAAVSAFGTIDILINNAGKGCSANPSEASVADSILDDMVNINVKSALYGMQEVLPYFTGAKNNADGVKPKGGHIINVSSILGRCPMPNPFALERSAYTASKHMLTAFTDLFRIEMQQKQTDSNIVVSLFSPGVVGTDFGLNAGGGDSRLIPGVQDVAEVAEVLIEEVIVKRREDVYSLEHYKGVVEGYLKERHSK